MSKSIPMKVQAAVSKFEAARANFEAFRKQNPKFAEEYEMLREAYNSTLKEAKSTYKDNHEKIGKKLGEFSVRGRTLIDGKKLLDLMGPKADALVSLEYKVCLLYTSPSPRDKRQSRMPSSA